jgi:hypothetical protein
MEAILDLLFTAVFSNWKQVKSVFKKHTLSEPTVSKG